MAPARAANLDNRGCRFAAMGASRAMASLKRAVDRISPTARKSSWVRSICSAAASARLTPHAPPGLVFRTVEVLPEGCKKACVQSVSYEAPIPAPDRAGLGGRIEHLLAASSWPIERARGRAPIDLRPLVTELALDEDVLKMRLQVDSRGSAGPREVLAALGLTGIERQGSHLRRTAVEICA